MECLLVANRFDIRKNRNCRLRELLCSWQWVQASYIYLLDVDVDDSEPVTSGFDYGFHSERDILAHLMRVNRSAEFPQSIN